VAFVGELEWVWDGPRTAGGRELDARTYHDWLSGHRLFRRHGFALNRALPIGELPRDLLEQMRHQRDPRREKALVGCQVHNWYDEARRCWPNARFIHIVRDGRDVCASWIKLGWLGNGYEAGLRWRAALDEWDRVRPLIPADQSTEVRFEALVRAPEAELSRLCTFLGVPYDANMLRYHEDTTYEPIDPNQAGKWVRQLARRDVQLFEAAAGSALVQQGYALSGERALRLRPWSRPLIAIDDSLRHHRTRARTYGISLWLADIAARRLRLRDLWSRVRLRMNEVDDGLLQ
jgi:hypothetical protein